MLSLNSSCCEYTKVDCNRIAYKRNKAFFTEYPGAHKPTYFLKGLSLTGISLIKKLSPISKPLGGNCVVLFLAYKHLVCCAAFLIVAVETTYFGLMPS